MSTRWTRPLSVLFLDAVLCWGLWSVDSAATLAPSRFDRASLTTLINEQGPTAGAMSMLRLLMLAATVYVAALMLATIAARATRHKTLERRLAGWTPRVLRPVLGALIVSSTMVGQPAHAQSDKAPVMIRVDDATDTPSQPAPTVTVTTSTSPHSTVADATVPDDAEPTTNGPVMRWIGPAPSSSNNRRAAPEQEPGSATVTWTVERGDHLWHIAEATLLGRLDRLPTEPETHRYWTAVIAANRERLVDPDNPSLIYPGQVFLLPTDDTSAGGT